MAKFDVWDQVIVTLDGHRLVGTVAHASKDANGRALYAVVIPGRGIHFFHEDEVRHSAGADPSHAFQ